jgi:DNA-binding NtrC family response regulator
MRYPQIVLFETDSQIARQFEELVQDRGWLVRESRQAPACLGLLRAGGPSVLIVKLGRNLLRELSFVDEVHACLPDVPVVVIGDAEDPGLMALAYELGAAYVLFPPANRNQLVEIARDFLLAAIERRTLPAQANGKNDFVQELANELGS